MAIYKDTTPTKDGRSWYFKVYKKDIEGNNKCYKSKRYATKKEAQEEERLFLMKRDNPSRKEFILVANDFFKEYKRKRKISSYESCMYAYNNHILPYFKKLYINDITIPIVRDWKEKLEEKGYSVNYNNKIYNVLNNIIIYAMRNYGLETNPLSILGRFERKQDQVIQDKEKLRYITLEDFDKFISVIDNITWKTFFIFLYYTGMRKGEVLALNWNDIDLKNDIIKVDKTLYYKHNKGEITSTKTGVNRTIKISKRLRDSLIEYKQEMMKYADYNNNWYVFGNTKFLAPATIDRMKNYYFDKSGITPITIHEFRHSHVSLLVNEYIKKGGTDTSKFFLMMSNRMGHTIETMKRTYLHLFPTIQDDIVDLLDNL